MLRFDHEIEFSKLLIRRSKRRYLARNPRRKSTVYMSFKAFTTEIIIDAHNFWMNARIIELPTFRKRYSLHHQG